MLTTKAIDTRFEEFARSNKFIKEYSRGEMHDFNQGKEDEYPRMHTIYKGATYQDNVKRLSYEIYFLSLPNSDHDDEDQLQIVSDMERAAEDLLVELFLHQSIAQPDTSGDSDFLQVNRGTDFGIAYEDANVTPMVESTKNVLCGVRLDLSVTVGWRKLQNS